jgi:hypothetical protein
MKTNPRASRGGFLFLYKLLHKRYIENSRFLLHSFQGDSKMMPTALWIARQQNILTPPTEGEFDARGRGPLISLYGTTFGIRAEDGQTWHFHMAMALRELSYSGHIYIPCRLDVDIGDNDSQLNEQEKKNNRRALDASAVVVFYQPKNIAVDISIWVPFVLEAERSSRSGKKAYVFGADDPRMLGIENDSHFTVHIGCKATAKAAYEAMYPLREH